MDYVMYGMYHAHVSLQAITGVPRHVYDFLWASATGTPLTPTSVPGVLSTGCRVAKYLECTSRSQSRSFNTIIALFHDVFLCLW